MTITSHHIILEVRLVVHESASIHYDTHTVALELGA